jgi:cell division septum initiation protein DivIVA
MRMNEVANASINTFGPSPKADFETPSDQLITLTYGQLQGLIEAAIRPLQDEIAQLHEDITSLEAAQDTLSDNQLIQLRLINELKEKASHGSPATTKKSTDHIDELHRLMIEEKTQQVSIAKAARLLGISKERMRQLKPLILKDNRFEIGWASVAGRKGTVIRIHKFL